MENIRRELVLSKFKRNLIKKKKTQNLNASTTFTVWSLNIHILNETSVRVKFQNITP